MHAIRSLSFLVLLFGIGGTVQTSPYAAEAEPGRAPVPTPAGVVRYVDRDATGPVHDGTSWCTGFLNLQDALAATAPDSGDTIRVANGTYKPDQGIGQTAGDRLSTFRLKAGVTVRGGYAGCGASDPDERDVTANLTVLSGDLAGDDGPNFANNGENQLSRGDRRRERERGPGRVHDTRRERERRGSRGLWRRDH